MLAFCNKHFMNNEKAEILNSKHMLQDVHSGMGNLCVDDMESPNKWPSSKLTLNKIRLT